jgi:hypothetical protein
MATAVENQKAAIKASWGAAAEGWDRWFGWYEDNFGPAIRWCCDAAGARPGISVKDIAWIRSAGARARAPRAARWPRRRCSGVG